MAAQTQQAQIANLMTQVNQLTVETANAYKTASDRAGLIINRYMAENEQLYKQLDQAKKQESLNKAEIAELKEKLTRTETVVGQLQAHIHASAAPSTGSTGAATGDNVST